MSIQGTALVVLFLCAGTTFGAKVHHDLEHAASSSSAAFLVNRKDSADGGLDDDNMAHLSDSIQGLFGDNAQGQSDASSAMDQLVASAIAAPAAPTAAPAVRHTQKAEVAKPVTDGKSKHVKAATHVAKPSAKTVPVKKLPTSKTAKVVAKPLVATKPAKKLPSKGARVLAKASAKTISSASKTSPSVKEHVVANLKVPAKKVPAAKKMTASSKPKATTVATKAKSSHQVPAPKAQKVVAKPKTSSAVKTSKSVEKVSASKATVVNAKSKGSKVGKVGLAHKVAASKAARTVAKPTATIGKPKATAAKTTVAFVKKTPAPKVINAVAKPPLAHKDSSGIHHVPASKATKLASKPKATATEGSAKKEPIAKAAKVVVKASHTKAPMKASPVKKVVAADSKHAQLAKPAKKSVAFVAARKTMSMATPAHKLSTPKAPKKQVPVKAAVAKPAELPAKPKTATKTGLVKKAAKKPMTAKATVAKPAELPAKPKTATKTGLVKKVPAPKPVSVVAKPKATAMKQKLATPSKTKDSKVVSAVAKPTKATKPRASKAKAETAKPLAATPSKVAPKPVSAGHPAPKAAKTVTKSKAVTATTAAKSVHAAPASKAVSAVIRAPVKLLSADVKVREVPVKKVAVKKIPVKKAATTMSPVKKEVPVKKAPVKKVPTSKVPAPKAAKAVAKASQTKAAAVAVKPQQPKVSTLASDSSKSNVVRMVSNRVQLKVPMQSSSGAIIVTKLQVAQQAIAKTSKININNTLVRGTININASVNVSHVEAPKNATKVIEEAVPSLPMASFALDTPQVTKNASEEHKPPKFPGNATQKAAFEKREKFLEDQIATLKARLSNVSSVVEKSHPAPKEPTATGTFNSHIGGDGKAKAPAKFKLVVSPKEPAPMEPIRKEKKPKAKWPTMGSVAAPVPVVLNAHSAAPPVAPPQKEAIAQQEGKAKNLSMGSAFTGTPAKKTQSIMALEASVAHDATVVGMDTSADASAPGQPTPSRSWWNVATSFFSRAFRSPPEQTVVHEQAAPHRATSLLDASTSRGLRQDMERTEEATQADGQHIVSLNSVWGEMETEDRNEEDRVRSEDAAERVRATTPQKVSPMSKSEMQSRHGADVSGFWGKLEREDSDIENSVQADNLVEYERLREDQDNQVVQAADQLRENKLHTDRTPLLKHSDSAFLAKSIHDPWESLEAKDRAIEHRIHDSPDLQMLQMNDDLHTIHGAKAGH